MQDLTSKTVAVFARPFTVPGFGEMLPAGEYEIETELDSPPGHLDPEAWKASVMLKLHPRKAHPGLTRVLTVSLADLDRARARDQLTGRALSHFYLEEMLADPMVRLVMEADGVSEAHLRHLYSGLRATQLDGDGLGATSRGKGTMENAAIESAENEGMRPEADVSSPPRAVLKSNTS